MSDVASSRNSPPQGWIGVDLDGTFAFYDKWRGHKHIGAPIPLMLERIKRWISEGRTVKIFTARVSGDPEEAAEVRMAVVLYCLEHVGVALEVTCVKDYAMLELYDDRAVQVTLNTGVCVGHSTRGLLDE